MYSDLLNYNGGFYVKFFKRDIDSKSFDTWRSKLPGNFNSLSTKRREEEWAKLLNTNPGAISLSPMIIGMNHDTGHIGPGNSNSTNNFHNSGDDEDCRKKPFVSLRDDFGESSVFGGEGAYLIIKGNFTYHDEDRTPFPMQGGAKNGDLKRAGDLKDADQFFFWCRLKWGDYYWNGEAWNTSPTDFKLWWREKDKLGRDDRKNSAHYDKEFEFIDTAQSLFACSEKGVYVPAPVNVNVSGKPDFIIYANRDMTGDSRRSHWHPKYNYGDNFYCRYYSRCIFIKGFDLKAYISNGILEDRDNESDTVYSNFISNGAVNEMDEITFKVCTFDHKKPTYSLVDYLVNGKSKYLEHTYNKALNSAEADSTGSSGIKAQFFQEEHFVFKTVSQYEEPRVILDLNLKNNNYKLYGTYTDKTISGKTYVPMTISTDYKYNKQTLKLIEKF